MIEFIHSLPDYFGKGLLQLIIITVGGLIVGWVTSTIFARRSEINAVEGLLLRRKLDIYEELNSRLEKLKSMEVIPADVLQVAAHLLEESQTGLEFSMANQFFKLFSQPAALKEEFLQLDEFIATKRIYFDEEVSLQSLRFRSYFGTLRHLQVLYEEQFVNDGISLESPAALHGERILGIQLGMLLQSEFDQQIDNLTIQLRDSIQNLSFAHKGETKHTYDYYNSPDEPVMSELINTILFTNREQITQVVTNAVAAGMAFHIEETTRKKKSK